MSTNRPASAILFLVTLGAGLVLAVAGVLGGRDEVPRGRASVDPSLVDGSLASEFDNLVEERHPLRDPAISLLAASRYALFGDATGPAVVGGDGWLFTLEEFERRRGDRQRLTERVGEIEAVSERLESLGIELVVALVPSKARVAAGRLPSRWRELAAHPRLDLAVEELASLSIPVVDLRGALAGDAPERRDASDDPPPLFFARDTHWTPAGARRAALAVAARVRRDALVRAATASEYVREAGEPTDVPGDLMSFLPLGALRDAFGLDVERAVPPRAELAPGSGGGAAGLFGDVEIPVALVGTSYSRDERWGFAEELKLALDADVLNVASEGEGPFAPMREYLASETIRDPKPQLVVWEIPERYLTLPPTRP